MEHLSGRKRQRFEHDSVHHTAWLNFNHSTHPPTSFTNYPVLRGWCKSAILKGDLRKAHPSLSSVTPEEISLSCAAMLQSWLYLGFLEGMTGKRIDMDAFISPDIRDDSFKSLHSNSLIPFIKIWRPLILAFYFSDPRRFQKEFDQLSQDISEAQSICFHLSGKFALNPSLLALFPTYPPLLETILPSIILLLEAVVGITKKAYPSHPGLSYSYIFFPPQAEEARLQRLINKGWCPFAIDKLRKIGDNSLISWIDVSEYTKSGRGHEKCSRLQCEVYQVDTSSYQTKHVEEGCECAFVVPAMEDIQCALEGNMIPCITIIDKDSQFSLEVIPVPPTTSPETPSHEKPQGFIAFSHVWADGLGSTSERGLPKCQLHHISALLSALPSAITGHPINSSLQRSPAFWIDSLCIPSNPTLRKRAIIQMSQIYSSASAVLVLDSNIRNFSPTRECTERLLLEIVTSGWMDRLWTYQESFLARKLIFAMKGGLIELDPSAANLPKPSLPLGTMWIHLVKDLEKLKPPQPKGITKAGGVMLGMVHSSLRWRSTSKSDDETLAIASLFGINTSELLGVKGEERKVKFWRLLGSVPRNVIHLAGPKLSLDGFKWAPMSLMHRSEGVNTILSTEGEAVVTERGLVGVWEGLLLNEMMICMAGEDVNVQVKAVGEGGEEVYHLTGLAEKGLEFRFDAVLGGGKGWGDMAGMARIATAIVFVGDTGRADEGEMEARCTQRIAVRKVAREALKGDEKVVFATFRNLHLCIQ